ncbi:MAG TPA: hypothetical protein VJB16_07860, partial [archaeon]|nr:hypothetical protein [archaeon]
MTHQQIWRYEQGYDSQLRFWPRFAKALGVPLADLLDVERELPEREDQAPEPPTVSEIVDNLRVLALRQDVPWRHAGHGLTLSEFYRRARGLRATISGTLSYGQTEREAVLRVKQKPVTLSAPERALKLALERRDHSQQAQLMVQAFHRLERREPRLAHVLRLRLGVGQPEGSWSLEGIGRSLGLTRSGAHYRKQLALKQFNELLSRPKQPTHRPAGRESLARQHHREMDSHPLFGRARWLEVAGRHQRRGSGSSGGPTGRAAEEKAEQRALRLRGYLADPHPPALKALAELLGVSRQTIYHDLGRHPDIPHVRRASYMTQKNIQRRRRAARLTMS